MDVLLSRYSSIDYILRLPYNEGLKLYNKALEQKIDNRQWDIFINTNHEKAISFENWKKQNVVKYKEQINKVTNKFVDENKINKIIEADRKKFKLKGGL